MSRRRLRESDTQDFLEIGHGYYGPLAYHNFYGHILNVLGYAEADRAELLAKNVYINPNEHDTGGIFHDANYHLDHEKHGYSTKEEFSADIAGHEMEKKRIFTQSIERVQSAIIATTPDPSIQPQTNLEGGLVVADVGNIGDSFPVCLYSSFLLVQESLQRGIPLKSSFREHAKAAQAFLRAFLLPVYEFETRNGKLVTLERQKNIRRNIENLGSLGLFDALTLLPRGVKELRMPAEWIEDQVA